ncbi:hypothetical protein ACFL4Z_02740 [candidate division KSB1 bacterium]
MASIDKKVIGIISSIAGTIIVPLIVKNIPKVISKLSSGKKQIEVNSEPQQTYKEGDKDEIE